MKQLSIIFIFILAYFNEIYTQKISFTPIEIAWADSMMQQMTLREKIGQLFMLDIHPDSYNSSKKEYILKAIKENNLGGVILMKGEYEIARGIANEFQEASKIPLWIAIDGEWGINMRISNTLKYPYQMTLGAIQDTLLIRKLGSEIGKECKSIGVNVNFAPCVDVNINPKNPVINYRSFGENKYNVATKGAALALGMQQEKVMTSFKHFPGHGDTDVDSHFDIPSINKPKESLQNIEIFPFNYLIKKNIWGAMVSHLSVPSLDTSKVPASFSYAITTQLLRKELKFDGIVFSDALNMKGATKTFSSDESDLEAYKAGNDVLVFPSNMEKAITKIEEYITSDIEKFEDFYNRVRKLLLFKAKVGLNESKITSYNPTYNSATSNNPNYEFCQKLYDLSLTYISETNTDLSEFLNSSKKLLLIKIGQDKDEIIANGLNQKEGISMYSLPLNSTSEERMKAIELAQNYDKIVVLYKDMSQHSSKQFGFNKFQINFIKEINTLPNVLNIIMGNPYSLNYFQEAKNVLLAYEDNTFSNQAVLNCWLVNNKTFGKLPVQVGKFRFENKIDLKHKINSEAYSDISNIEYDNASLEKAEKMVEEMMRDQVIPGCQIVVRHKGNEIYNKSFGYTTYEPNSTPISPNHLYDLASLTKILSTTLAAMKLKDMGRLRIYSPINDYIKLDSSATIGSALISQLLTHTAGLTPFIPFYSRFNSDNFYQYFSNLKEGKFQIKVAENLYVRDDFRDSMWYEMSHSEIKNRGEYKYSDLSMYALQKVIESIANNSLQEIVKEVFYKPMGVNLTYNPLENGVALKNIVPTENDQVFRKQLIHGYVHDQGACLYGGVSGHAGLFGNAKDVAKIMNMIMNYGKIDEKQYLNELTVRQFTAQQNETSRRGLGFDRPETDGPTSYLCSQNTFGHTGFTGTCAWADPDNQLVFVFLSNRIHPSAENNKLISGKYRQKLQTYFYNYIGVKK